MTSKGVIGFILSKTMKIYNSSGRDAFLNKAKNYNQNAEYGDERLNTRKIVLSISGMPIYTNEHLTIHAKILLESLQTITEQNINFAYA